jgi:hypothetical protein
MTLDAPFYHEHGPNFKWPEPQDPEACKKLFTDSPSITYLEHEAATIYLNAENGPHTCFRVFGSPRNPNNRRWAFRYTPEGEEERLDLWDVIPSDSDIVVTHTPARGHVDLATKDDRTGCAALLRALHRVRPMLSVCGHIHEARGVERVRWNTLSPKNDLTPKNNLNFVEAVEVWQDPGVGGNKQSLVNVSAKGGRRLDNGSRLTRQMRLPTSLIQSVEGGGCGGQPAAAVPGILQPSTFNSTSRPTDSEAGEERVKAVAGGALEYRRGSAVSDNRLESEEFHVDDVERNETVMINAAFLGPRIPGKPMQFNKPIVVDVDLPVWSFEEGGGCET